MHGVRTLAHADGGAVIYLDQSADQGLAMQVIERSLDRLGVCNRLNLLLVQGRLGRHRSRVADLAGRLGIAVSLPPHQHELGHEWALDAGSEATITMAPAAGAEDAAEIANRETSGLAASIVASDADAARRFLDDLFRHGRVLECDAAPAGRLQAAIGAGDRYQHRCRAGSARPGNVPRPLPAAVRGGTQGASEGSAG